MPEGRTMSRLYPFQLRRDVRARLKSCMARHLKPGDGVYDVGCGTKPFSDFLSERGMSYVGIDAVDGFYGTARLDIVGTADAVPLGDGVADAVVSSQVIEHLADPEAAIEEARRILKRGGLLFVSFPFLYPLHAAPRDYFRYSRHGFEAICDRHGFEVVERHHQAGFWYAASIYCDLYVGALDRSLAGGLPILTILALPFQWLLWLLHKIEGAARALAGKDAAGARDGWAVNSVYVVRKK
jgi:SAM-dependent methyltransferase